MVLELQASPLNKGKSGGQNGTGHPGQQREPAPPSDRGLQEASRDPRPGPQLHSPSPAPSLTQNEGSVPICWMMKWVGTHENKPMVRQTNE